ncbi:hypothetical protein ACRAWF_16840 [Streptomyces sp. L7]
MPLPSQPTDARRPRAMVIDGSWRALGPGLEPLSGPGGAPLTRTVKLILLPLIVRPALHPELAADFLTPEPAAQLDALIRESGGGCSRRHSGSPSSSGPAGRWAWWRATPRTCISSGVSNSPPSTERPPARAPMRVHSPGPSSRTWPTRTAAARWTRSSTTSPTTPNTPVSRGSWPSRGRAADLLRPLIRPRWSCERLEVLEACGRPDRPQNSPEFGGMVEAGDGDLLGRAPWADPAEVWGRSDVPVHLGLTERQLPPRPQVGRGASTATLPAPLDRTLFERLFVVLQSSARREELPTVPELIRREVGRSCAPLGLYDESLRVAVVLGGRLAVGLDPLGTREPAPGADLGSPGGQQPLATGRPSVLRARRMTVSPRPDTDGGVLNALAQDLRTPWAAHMRRLWVRLHGRDVRDAPLADTAAAWAGARRGRPLGDDGPPGQGPVGAARAVDDSRHHRPP